MLDDYYNGDLAVADFNNDGWLDILVFDNLNTNVFNIQGINWNQGAGNDFAFQPIEGIYLNSNTFCVKQIVIQDFDQDGALDFHLIGIEKTEGQAFIKSMLYQQTCQGCFAYFDYLIIEELPSWSTFFNTDIMDSHSVDLNLDGWPDLSVGYQVSTTG